jgi:hypothetical protein
LCTSSAFFPQPLIMILTNDCLFLCAPQSLLIRPTATKPASSYLSSAQQQEASQSLELERRLFPKIQTPGASQRTAHSEDGSGSEDSSSDSDAEESGSESGEELASEEEEDASDVEARGGTVKKAAPKNEESDEEQIAFGQPDEKPKPRVAQKQPRKAHLASLSAPASPTPTAGNGAERATKTTGKKAPKSPAVASPGGESSPAPGPGRGGRGGRGRGAAGGRGAGRGAGRGGATSKRTDLEPSLLKSLIAGTATVNVTSSEPAAPAAGKGAAKEPKTAADKKRKLPATPQVAAAAAPAAASSVQPRAKRAKAAGLASTQ